MNAAPRCAPVLNSAAPCLVTWSSMGLLVASWKMYWPLATTRAFMSEWRCVGASSQWMTTLPATGGRN